MILDTVETIEKLAIEFLNSRDVVYEDPVVIDGYDEDGGYIYYNIVFRINKGVSEAFDLYWDFLDIMVDSDLVEKHVFVDFIGRIE